MGLLKCGLRGCTTTAERKKGKYVYYRCTGFKGACGNVYIRQEKLAALLREVIKPVQITPDVAADIATAIRQSDGDAAARHAAALQQVEKRRRTVVSKIDRGQVTVGLAIANEGVRCVTIRLASDPWGRLGRLRSMDAVEKSPHDPDVELARLVTRQRCDHPVANASTRFSRSIIGWSAEMFAQPIGLFAGQVSNPATFCRQVNSRLSDDDRLGLRSAVLSDRNGR